MGKARETAWSPEHEGVGEEEGRLGRGGEGALGSSSRGGGEMPCGRRGALRESLGHCDKGL